MSFPVYIPTRNVSVGGAAVLESSDLLKIQVAITSSRSLIWNDTGFRFESYPKAALSGLGTEVSIALPRTDVAGWRDAATGSLIDVSAEGSYSHQYTAQIRFLDANDNVIGGQYTLGPFALPDGEGTFDLDTGVPASTVAGGVINIPDLWSQMVADAQAAAASAAASLVELDATTAANITTPSTDTAQALSSTIGAVVDTTPDLVRTPDESRPLPLAGLGRAKSGPFRILQVGTSIAYNSYAPNQLVSRALANVYGTTALFRQQAGLINGSYETAEDGWLKQPFSGQMFTRLRGSSSSSTLDRSMVGFGDEVVIEWSRESDSAPMEIFVDGVSVGSVGSAGLQKFTMRDTFTVTRGLHSVTIGKPASGYAYLEAVEIRDSTRRGVETLDFTKGGSSLLNAVTYPAATGAQTGGITTTPGAGIQSIYGRDDVDLILDTFTVNDAGSGGPTDGSDYRLWREQAARAALANGTPLVLITEPAGHYAMLNDAGSPNGHLRYEAIKQIQADMADEFPNVFLADWDSATRIEDIADYAAAYYPTVAALNVAAGTYTGDFIHPDGAIADSAQDIGTDVLFETLGIAEVTPPEKKWEDVRLAEVNARAASFQPFAFGTNPPFKAGTLFRSASVTNLRTAMNTTIAASGLSDANGKYTLAVNATYSMGSITGPKMVVIRIGPNDSGLASVVMSGTNQRFYGPDGTELVFSGTKQFGFASLSAGTCLYLAFPFTQDLANTFMTLTGRIYEAWVTDSAIPVVGTAP